MRPRIVVDCPQVYTHFGWARASIDPPKDIDLHWVKMPEKHVYTWDGDGWYRIDPPERHWIPGDLKHE